MNYMKDSLISHTDPAVKPLCVDLALPLPERLRIYAYNCTHPTGGRTVGEHKIQLMVPGQRRGQRGSFDFSDGRIVLLLGYVSDVEVFVMWDAGLYAEFPYSRNVQITAEKVIAAFAGNIVTQIRHLRGGVVESVVATRGENLKDALLLRQKLTLDRLLAG